MEAELWQETEKSSDKGSAQTKIQKSEKTIYKTETQEITPQKS